VQHAVGELLEVNGHKDMCWSCRFPVQVCQCMQPTFHAKVSCACQAVQQCLRIHPDPRGCVKVVVCSINSQGLWGVGRELADCVGVVHNIHLQGHTVRLQAGRAGQEGRQAGRQAGSCNNKRSMQSSFRFKTDAAHKAGSDCR
jgi:hypothetical protein